MTPAYLGGLAITFANLVFRPREHKFTPNLASEFEQVSNHKQDEKLEPITINSPVRYLCQLTCLSCHEIEALASLVQLSKEHELVPSSISSHKLDSPKKPEQVRIEVEFVSDRHNTKLQLQQVIVNLKSSISLLQASWKILGESSETSNSETRKFKIVKS